MNVFLQVGNYSSYCRCVKSERFSNGKKKGMDNRKNGNKYLGWAYVEVANFRHSITASMPKDFINEKRPKQIE